MKKNRVAINMAYANDKSCANIIGVCDGSPEYQGAEAEEGVPPGMEHIQVRRRSSRTLQLPPLVFRQAEQHDWNSREMESIARPTTLALRIPPLIAITSADTGRENTVGSIHIDGNERVISCEARESQTSSLNVTVVRPVK
ncbi:hypothetical protein PO909_023054 [Leuciscus waleckii]